MPLDFWKGTYATLHMWSQIVGKVRLSLTPLMNHWWNVPLYVSARGLTTSRISYGERSFELWFDFIRHQLVLETSEGVVKTVQLAPRTGFRCALRITIATAGWIFSLTHEFHRSIRKPADRA